MKSIDKLCRLIWWIIQNWRIITWAKVKNFIVAKYNMATSGYNDWKLEQAFWREGLTANKSPQCVLGGKCIHCGCDTPDKFFEPAACEHGCYPEWMEEKEWLEFQKNNIAA